MKVRYKDNHDIVGYTNQFNLGGIGEVIVTFEDGDASSEYVSDLEIWLEHHQQWYPMSRAFQDKLLISDNYGRSFAEPKTGEERVRGWY